MIPPPQADRRAARFLQKEIFEMDFLEVEL